MKKAVGRVVDKQENRDSRGTRMGSALTRGTTTTTTKHPHNDQESHGGAARTARTQYEGANDGRSKTIFEGVATMELSTGVLNGGVHRWSENAPAGNARQEDNGLPQGYHGGTGMPAMSGIPEDGMVDP